MIFGAKLDFGVDMSPYLLLHSSYPVMHTMHGNEFQILIIIRYALALGMTELIDKKG